MSRSAPVLGTDFRDDFKAALDTLEEGVVPGSPWPPVARINLVSRDRYDLATAWGRAAHRSRHRPLLTRSSHSGLAAYG